MRRGTIAQALQSGPPAGKNPWGIHAGDGLVRRIASAEAGVWTQHPGRGWDVPTEALIEGDYGFSVESGSIDSGAQLGEKLVYTVTASNAPVIRWRMAGDDSSGEFYRPATVVIKCGIVMSATAADGMDLLQTRKTRPTSAHYWGGGIRRTSGLWYAYATDTGAAMYNGAQSFADAHLAVIDMLCLQEAPRESTDGNQTFQYAWVSPHETLSGDIAHASCRFHGDSGVGSGTENDDPWYVDTRNVHPGSGGDATVTIHSVKIIQHPRFAT